MNDNSLIDQIRSGDQKALGVLYADHRVEFLRWISRDFRCPDDDAKDIYQVAVLIVYENIHRGKLNQMTSTLKTYLFGVGKNLAHDWSRKNQRQQPFEQEAALYSLVTDPFGDDTIADDSRLNLVSVCLKKLGPPCQELLEMFYFCKKSMEELTLSLGYKNADTAKSQKYKCMSRLRKYYEEECSKQLT